MEDINGPGKPDGVDGAIGVTVKIIHDFQHAPPAKPSQGFDGGMLIAILGIVDCDTHHAANIFREFPQVIAGGSDPFRRLLVFHWHGTYSILTIIPPSEFLIFGWPGFDAMPS
jgi:hypothetical protein